MWTEDPVFRESTEEAVVKQLEIADRAQGFHLYVDHNSGFCSLAQAIV